jgi:hypothetical protein
MLESNSCVMLVLLLVLLLPLHCSSIPWPWHETLSVFFVRRGKTKLQELSVLRSEQGHDCCPLSWWDASPAADLCVCFRGPLGVSSSSEAVTALMICMNLCSSL